MLQLSLVADLSTTLKTLSMHIKGPFQYSTLLDTHLLNKSSNICWSANAELRDTGFRQPWDKIALSAVCFRTNSITSLVRIWKERWLSRWRHHQKALTRSLLWLEMCTPWRYPWSRAWPLYRTSLFKRTLQAKTDRNTCWTSTLRFLLILRLILFPCLHWHSCFTMASTLRFHVVLTFFFMIKGLFTLRRGTPGRWGNLLRWGNPPVHRISHFNLITFTW